MLWVCLCVYAWYGGRIAAAVSFALFARCQRGKRPGDPK